MIIKSNQKRNKFEKKANDDFKSYETQLRMLWIRHRQKE